MGVPSYLNGQSGHITFASSGTVDVTSWTATIDVEVLETTTTGSLGWQNNINGIKKMEGNLKLPFDTANVPTGATIDLAPGQTGTLTLLIGNSADSITGPVRISKVEIVNEAKGVVTFSADFVSTGVMVLPS